MACDVAKLSRLSILTLMSQPIDVVILGAGNRGNYAYGEYALQHPEQFNVVAVAEPDAMRRARFASLHDVPPENQFSSWQDLLNTPQLGRALINCTQDQMHVDSTIAVLKAGYDVLLEKPMAVSARDCIRLVETAERYGRHLQICHVLRFTSFFGKLFEIVNSGRLGRIMTIDHRENVAYYHMAHSFVRGNWRNEAESAPMILAKCCHDFDLLIWIMQQRIARLQSFGALSHYRKENAPTDAPFRCTDGCAHEQTCAWYAPRLYGALPDTEPMGKFMASALEGGNTPQSRFEKLKNSPYGRCVYHCDNDVVDHQVLALEFEGGATATFTMHGHSDVEGRTMRWDGTRATLYGDFTVGRPYELRICDHGSNNVEVIRFDDAATNHGGGDFGIMRDFFAALNGQSSIHRTTARMSLASHLVCFAAEESRLQKRMVEIQS